MGTVVDLLLRLHNDMRVQGVPQCTTWGGKRIKPDAVKEYLRLYGGLSSFRGISCGVFLLEVHDILKLW